MIISINEALPPLFEMDNFSSCIQDEKNIFCNVQATLEFSRSNKTLVEFIENVTSNKKKFDRNIIHRGLCMAKYETQNSTLLKSYSKKLVNQSLKNFTFTDVTDVEVISCTENNQPLSYYDELILVSTICYLALIIYSTIYERRNRNEQKSEKGALFKVLKHLSLSYNWICRTSESKNADFQKLLSMQSLRFFLMMAIVGIHVITIYTLSFMSNPVDYEKIMNYLFVPLWVFVVLPFFLLSSWLLTLQVNNLIETHGEISLKHVGIIVLNRYFRLSFTVAVSVLLLLSSWPTRFKGPLTFTALNLNADACKKNWIYSLIFAGNFDTALDVCNSVTWYLSADFQIYVINLLVLYVKFKYKFKDIIYYSVVMLGACILHGIFLYSHGHDIIFSANIRHFEESVFRITPNFVVYYSSTYSVWGCSLLGLIFGEIYYKTKQRAFEKSKILTVLWAVLFISLPILALLLSTVETNGLRAAFLGIIVKPMFNLGFAIGILGMSRNIGGFIKNIFEYKYFVLLGNFTFCTYLVHMLPLIILHSRYDWPWTISFYQMVRDYIIVSLICWPLGILLTLIIEDIGLGIQKLVLPQIKKTPIQFDKQKEQ